MTSSDYLKTQESLNSAGAMIALEASRLEAERNGWQVCIAVVDAAGNLLAFQRMDEVPNLGIELAQMKARTAAYARAPSKAFADLFGQGDQIVPLAGGVVAAEGGLPIMVDGLTVGAIGVSGVEPALDAQIARAGVEFVTARGAANSARDLD